MQIEIPAEAEAIIRQRAKDAGFDDVREFVLRRALCDDQDLVAMEAAANDPRAEQLILEGIASGPATPMTSDDWRHVRDSVKARLGINGESH